MQSVNLAAPLTPPHGQLLYIPLSAVTLLTATGVSYRPDAMTIGAGVHVVSWILQFIGHGFAEKRAPALLDNLLGGAHNFTR